MIPASPLEWWLEDLESRYARGYHCSVSGPVVVNVAIFRAVLYLSPS